MILPVPSEVEHSVLLEHEFAISQLVVQRRELEGSLFCKILHVVVETVISHQEQDFSEVRPWLMRSCNILLQRFGRSASMWSSSPPKAIFATRSIELWAA